MNRYTKNFLLVMLFMFFMLTARTEAMALNSLDGDIRELLRSTARAGNVNLVLDESVKGHVSLSLRDVEPGEAIRMIAGAGGFSCIEENGVLIVSVGKQLRNALGNLSDIYTYPVKYADIDNILPICTSSLKITQKDAGISETVSNKKITSQNLGIEQQPVEKKTTERQSSKANEALSMQSWIAAERDTNTLVLYGTPGQARQIEKIISAVDIPAKQVSLEAKVVALKENTAEKLGISWETAMGTSGTAGEGSSGRGIYYFGPNKPDKGSGPFYSAMLDALSTQGKAKILARPNVTTIQGREAIINIGGEIPIPKTYVTVSASTTSYEYRQAGIILRCRPQVNADGYITAAVHTEVSSPLYEESMKAYRFQNRSADTIVRMKDGETMVIGGLIGSEESRTLSKIPFLGDLPILGNFFKSKKTSRESSEIMIFLTAHIIRD